MRNLNDRLRQITIICCESLSWFNSCVHACQGISNICIHLTYDLLHLIGRKSIWQDKIGNGDNRGMIGVALDSILTGTLLEVRLGENTGKGVKFGALT